MNRSISAIILAASIAAPSVVSAKGGLRANLDIAPAAIQQGELVTIGLSDLKLGKNLTVEVFYIPDECSGDILYSGARYAMPPIESADPVRTEQWIADGESNNLVDLDLYVSADTSTCTFKVYVRARKRGKFWDHRIGYFSVSR